MPRCLRIFVLLLLVFAWGGSRGHTQDTVQESPIYLFSTFKEPEQDGLRFAYSFDGYHW